MTDAIDLHKQKALELAAQAGGEPAKVVERAGAYHEFLIGKGAAPTKVTAPAATAKPATAATAAPAGKPADKPKATPAAGSKPAATAKPGAATPKAAAAGGAAPSNDTKDPKGNNTYGDVVAALQNVMRSVPGDNDKRDKGRKLAYDTLAAAGGGVKGVRELKPALYDTVVDACNAAAKAAAVKPKATATAKAAPAAAPADDLGGGEPEADDLAGDPPEETGGGLAAEEGQGTPDGEDA